MLCFTVYDHKTSKKYIFNGYYYKIDGADVLHFAHVDNVNRLIGCVIISLYENSSKYVEIKDIFHNDDYDNIILLQTAIKYLFSKYNDLEYILIDDIVREKPSSLFITPNRIIMNEPSWYEETLYAVASISTSANIRQFIKRTVKCMIYCTAFEYQGELSYLLATKWNIYREAIKNYTISYNITEITNDKQPIWFHDVHEIEKNYDSLLQYYIYLKYIWNDAKREWYASNEGYANIMYNRSNYILTKIK